MNLLFLLFSFFPSQSANWQTNFKDATDQAKKEHKYILLNFSGSDWCIPCIRLRKEIFNSSEFESYAAKNLVLVNADFPRLKKNKLSKDQVKENEKLADKYNKDGAFPFTLLLDEDGKIIQQWDGFPKTNAAGFVKMLTAYSDAKN